MGDIGGVWFIVTPGAEADYTFDSGDCYNYLYDYEGLIPLIWLGCWDLCTYDNAPSTNYGSEYYDYGYDYGYDYSERRGLRGFFNYTNSTNYTNNTNNTQPPRSPYELK